MNTEQRPGLVTAIAFMTLASGIINLFWGFVASATVLSSFFGIICLPITILPTILGAFEIVYAAKLLSAQPQPVQPSTSIAIFEILTAFFLNVFSLVVGVIVLVFYNDVIVKDYFARLNTTHKMDTAPTAESTPEPLPEITPEAPTDSEPEILTPPEKPKRTRKPAK